MALKTLPHGQIEGARCPYCEVVCQRPSSADDGTRPVDGLAAHMLALHTELYEQWAEAQSWV